MRILLRTTAWLFLLAAATAAPGGTDADAALRTRVQQLVEMMATGDASSRDTASAEFVKLGRAAVPHLPRLAHLLREPGGRDVVAAALAKIGLEDSIALLMAYPSNWPEKGRQDVTELIAALRALRDPKLATVVELAPAQASAAGRVPPDTEIAIDDRLPSSLAWGDFAVRKSKGSAQVDVDGNGARLEAVEADHARCLRVGPRKRPILVYARLDRWYAASGSVLLGKLRAEDVELWDADLDGTFTGPRDRLRIGDGAYQPIPANGLVFTSAGLATMTIRATAGGAAATFVPEPLPPDLGSWTVRALDVMNAWRRGVGLGPVLPNLTRAAACAKHVDYWRLNGFSGHDEVASRPGYSVDGAQAGRKSSVWEDPEPARLVRVITATVLHRSTCLGPSGEGLGVAAGSGSCLWGGDLDVSEHGAPLLVPGPGQEDVPILCETEQPTPDRDANFYGAPRGYPISVVWSRVWDDLHSARIEVFLAGPGGAADPVAGEEFTPERPYTAKGRTIETAAATFVAGKPLERRRTYVVRFRGERTNRPVELSWSFTTK
jgi:hypothetical protein